MSVLPGTLEVPGITYVVTLLVSLIDSLLQVTGQIPAERDGHTSCVINDNMYVFGGYEETHFRFGLDGKKLMLHGHIVNHYLREPQGPK